MKIYTGNAFGKDLEKVKELEMGIMISTSVAFPAIKDFKDVPCALDNGAFSCFKKGYPFQGDLFLENIKHCYKLGINLDFIVCPDILCGGLESLDFSLKWAENELLTAPRLALVVQDGMRISNVQHDLQRFSHVFIGGSVEWKWKTAEDWVKMAHDEGKKCHIGQCGQLKYIELAYNLGVDSIDSTSIQRNKSWHIIEQYNGRVGGFQGRLFNNDQT